MKGDIKISKNMALLLTAVLSFLAIGNFVSVVDAESNGGVTVVQDTTPVGTIAMWGTSTPPNDWIELNGQSTSGYPKLAAIYGSNVPDLRGEFVRGWDNNKGTDIGRNIGTLQEDAVDGSDLSFVGEPLPAHRHTHTRFSVGGSGGNIQWGNDAKRTTSTQNTSAVSAGTPTGIIQGNGTETRPRNIALMYIIKAE